MSDKPANLDQLQRWMQSVITHPEGVAGGLGSPEARRYLDVGPTELESVILPSRALGSEARLEIYVDAYFERLLECLHEEFVATRAAVGEELFQGLAFGYLQHYPSRSYTLNLLGECFPMYLAESRLHERAAPEHAGPGWGDWVIELASFERLLRAVFDAVGSEGMARLTAAQLTAPLSGLDAAEPAKARLLVNPALRLRKFDYPVHVAWAAAKAGQPLTTPAHRATYLAINRRDYVVERHELSPEQFVLLTHLVEGKSLLRAIALTAQRPEVAACTLERELASWFARWMAEGFFLGLDRESPV